MSKSKARTAYLFRDGRYFLTFTGIFGRGVGRRQRAFLLGGHRWIVSLRGNRVLVRLVLLDLRPHLLRVGATRVCWRVKGIVKEVIVQHSISL